MHRYSVYHLFAFLQLAFWTLDKPGLWAHCIIVSGASKGAPQSGDLARGLVNGNDIAAADLDIK